MKYGNIILASSSPRRRQLLEDMGLDFTIMPSSCEENVPLPLSPRETAMFLALEKALDIENKVNPNDLIIGCDTVVVYENTIFGKPADKKDAFRMLKALSGKQHEVISGISLITAVTPRKQVSFQTTSVKLHDISDTEIYEYIESDEPMDKAGSYAIQGIFSRYIAGYEGSYENVIGFPCKLFSDIMKSDFSEYI